MAVIPIQYRVGGNIHGTKLLQLHNFEDFHGYTVLAGSNYSIPVSSAILYKPSEQLKMIQPFSYLGFRLLSS